MSSLNGRVRSLERQERRTVGCQCCGGRGYYILEDGETAPAWLDASSCCTGCGEGVKVICRDLWDRLA